jgi:hypothetical protein
VIARADPVLGYTVKIEIDPLETDPKKPGYVDYANSRIYVGPNALVTEDVINYTNRRGTSIGGLVDGRSYFVITAGDGWIKLAETETQALRAAAGVEDGNIVKLTRAGVPATENNTHLFGAASVSDAANTITLNRSGAVFNPFELGQAVVYRAPVGGTAIANLVDGGTYYVVASTNEHNLQGNSRFADTQVLRLAESENESRAGVFIDIGPPWAAATSSMPSTCSTPASPPASASSPSSRPPTRPRPAPV